MVVVLATVGNAVAIGIAPQRVQPQALFPEVVEPVMVGILATIGDPVAVCVGLERVRVAAVSLERVGQAIAVGIGR